MISIYTRTNNPLKIEFWKWVGKKILRKYSGPDAVLDSLKRGLIELQVPFEINPLKPKYKIIHVISGIEVLRSTLLSKKNDKTILAGPNLVITPLDKNAILANNNIDIIITPSKWVSDFYVSLVPSFKNKIYSWPAGVQIPKITSTKNGKIIVIRKEIQNSIFEKIISILDTHNTPYEVLEYGHFSHQLYLKKLETAPILIYLQKTESQGLAIQEAWAYNVPTLVYQDTLWTEGIYSWSDPKISAPYLSNEAGSFFTLKNFEENLTDIINNKQINPQNYCKNNLSDQKSVQILLDIIKKHENN